VNRLDYAYPFRISPASRQAAQANYEDHVEQMVRQVLLTSPGERVNLPEFGCGLRQLLFAPASDALATTLQLQVMQALDRWLSGQIQVQKVEVVPPSDAPDPALLLVRVEYTLIETRERRSTLVEVS
jgi:phage baseplate assembly protein W